MPLSILAGVTNTMSTFLVAYTFISSESAPAFKFVNACCKVWDDCPGPTVMLGDFSLGFVSGNGQKKAGISVVEAGYKSGVMSWLIS